MEKARAMEFFLREFSEHVADVHVERCYADPDEVDRPDGKIILQRDDENDRARSELLGDQYAGDEYPHRHVIIVPVFWRARRAVI